MLPVVSIVGRPNVGKSTLFNRLIKQNKAIIHDQPGVTRDRIYGRVTWMEHPFHLIDTGGIVFGDEQSMEESVFEQAREAIESSQLVLFVTDGREGLTAMDEDVAGYLRQSNKPVVLVVNKVDGMEREGSMTAEFHQTGFPLVAVSSAHGHNISSLAEYIDEVLSGLTGYEEEEEEGTGLRLAMLGRPNVGKSSIVNAFSGQERMIVSPEAGTTRDTVDVAVEKNGRRFVFLDSAGVRRKTRINNSLERFSVLKSLKSSIRAQVTILVLDAVQGLVMQDKKLLSYLDREKVPFVVVVNKIDLIPRNKMREVKQYMEDAIRFCSHVPLVYTSAVTRAGLGGLLPLVEKLWDQCQKRVSTGQLNRFLQDVVQKHQPPVIKGRRAKLYYITQTGAAPPTFVFFVNDPARVKPSYVRYLERQLRKGFGLQMAPLRIYFRPRKKK